MTTALVILLAVIAVALIFEYINGFHDTANSIATVVATKVLSPGQAVLLAASTNLVGALAGTAVAQTIAAGLVDTKRVADLRAGSDFDRPAPGGSDVDNLLDYQKQGGFLPALQNLVRAGTPLVNEIVKNWGVWKVGVPIR